MDEPEEVEDVIIAGSELHQALVKMGYSDFEFTSINKTEFTSTDLPASNYKRLDAIRNFKRWPLSNSFFNLRKNTCRLSSKQLATILQMESLLDDHAAGVEIVLNKYSHTFWTKIRAWTNLLMSSAMLGIGYTLFKRKRSYSTILVMFAAALISYHEYEDFLAVRALKNLVTVQNELYHLYKKSLGILRNIYRFRVDRKKLQTKFSQLEIDRLKYLQPITEKFLKSMGKVSRAYYRASSMILESLPKNFVENDTLTHFEANAFTITGEITYENFRRLYYVYVLVQSDIMQLLAVAYKADGDANIEGIVHSQLTRIIVNLHNLLIKEKNELQRIIEKYESCRGRTFQRELRLTSASKWKDLYLNLDLLSRKLQTTYDEVGAVLQEIEKRKDDETTEDAFIANLSVKIQEIYSQIDKTRNFAEFNNMLIAILQRSRKTVDNGISKVDPLEEENDEEGIIVRDSEPQIIDEVFEEYITEEYLKPLYEESDETTMENTKFDKLLAKNFMSELKEVLVEKYKLMSEREARALLRKYCERRQSLNFGEAKPGELATDANFEKSIIPRPPPLPGPIIEVAEKLPTICVQEQKSKSRGPVPLPRARNFEKITQQDNERLIHFATPTSSSLSPSEPEALEGFERFSIGLPTCPSRKIPAFVTFDEEFIGSGENSEEEVENKDEANDESL